MKKIVLLFILFLSISSCSKPVEKEEIEYALMLEGEWICETQMQWEVMEFSRRGKCLYYNGIVAWNVENIRKYDGFYIIEDSNITGVCSSSFNNVDLDFTVLEISECEFTAKHNNTGVVKTYHKVIEECELYLDESITPSYPTLLESEIKRFRSHNDNIVSVNEKNGEIKAGSGGLVLIDVITESNDIAYVKIKVNGIMDLTPYLGMEQDRIFTIFGMPTVIEEEGIYYSIRDYLVDYIQFHLNANSEVQTISLKLIEDSLPKDSVIGYLDRMFVKGYNTSEFFNLYHSSNAKIAYFPEYNIIYFLQL
ncbi:MAG: hypothetical protein IKT74_05185 [Bacteroidales bacterium]|nr:hypothetical protein [Bacteroidales bacterium]